MKYPFLIVSTWDNPHHHPPTQLELFIRGFNGFHKFGYFSTFSRQRGNRRVSSSLCAMGKGILHLKNLYFNLITANFHIVILIKET